MSYGEDLNTIDDVVKSFVEGHNGPWHDPVDLRRLLEAMTTMPDPSDKYNDRRLSPGECYNRIQQYGLMYLRARTGWVDRSGKLWGCGYAAHEKLLYWLGLEAREVEAMGWARVGPHTTQHMFRLSREQRKAIREMGKSFDPVKNRELPEWTEPTPEIPVAGPQA